VHLLRRFDDLPADARSRVIADLDGETRELSHLVDEVVQLAGSAPADVLFERIMLVGPARSAVDRAVRRTGRQVVLGADDSSVLCQAILIERAIWNLVENAAKFSAADTPIEVVVADCEVRVADRGPGIDPGDLPHVFDRFYRATSDRSLPGSGLGLAIVRDVVQAHGGQVLAANRPCGGAELGFRLPAAPQP
jgi:two-component system sensor histidine kinase MprB